MIRKHPPITIKAYAIKGLFLKNSIILSLTLFLLLVNPLFSNGTPVTYLMWLSSFTGSQITIIKGYGYTTNNQPSKITEYVTAPNTNYARISIATTTSAENTAIQGLLAQGKIQQLEKIYLRSAYDGRTGGNSSWAEMEDCVSAPSKYVCPPIDWKRNWLDVEASSP